MEAALKDILISHSLVHPFMEMPDYIKLLYQNEFGCGHMVSCPAKSETCLNQEYAKLKALSRSEAAAIPKAEPVGNGLSRIFLRQEEVTPSFLPLLNRLFCATANNHAGTLASFYEKLQLLAGLAKEGSLPLSSKDLEQFISGYKKEGCPPIGHSSLYKRHYSPHYRVVKSAYLNFLPAFLRLWSLLQKEPQGRASSGSCILAAIDGRCGSGKTYLAALLSQVFSCPVIHMDDFFLPPSRRTAERLSTPGGNVDYERFSKEVAEPLSQGRAARFRPYDCHTDAYLPEIILAGKPLVLVEGSYALHPALADFYRMGIFTTCSPFVQRERLLRRNGPQLLARFEAEWIPMEEAYFSVLQPEAQCDIVLSTTDF